MPICPQGFTNFRKISNFITCFIDIKRLKTYFSKLFRKRISSKFLLSIYGNFRESVPFSAPLGEERKATARNGESLRRVRASPLPGERVFRRVGCGARMRTHTACPLRHRIRSASHKCGGRGVFDSACRKITNRSVIGRWSVGMYPHPTVRERSPLRKGEGFFDLALTSTLCQRSAVILFQPLGVDVGEILFDPVQSIFTAGEQAHIVASTGFVFADRLRGPVLVDDNG